MKIIKSILQKMFIKPPIVFLLFSFVCLFVGFLFIYLSNRDCTFLVCIKIHTFIFFYYYFVDQPTVLWFNIFFFKLCFYTYDTNIRSYGSEEVKIYYIKTRANIYYYTSKTMYNINLLGEKDFVRPTRSTVESIILLSQHVALCASNVFFFN